MRTNKQRQNEDGAMIILLIGLMGVFFLAASPNSDLPIRLGQTIGMALVTHYWLTIVGCFLFIVYTIVRVTIQLIRIGR